jgi:hypothetical protein
MNVWQQFEALKAAIQLSCWSWCLTEQAMNYQLVVIYKDWERLQMGEIMGT